MSRVSPELLTPHDPSSEGVVRASALTKVYGSGATAVHALASVDVSVPRGQLTVVMGPSGSGKSTLMHCLAGLDRPTSGSVRIGDQVIAELNDKALTRLRRNRVGFVFQSFNLIPTLTARENIELPLRLAGTQVDAAWFDEVVEVVGLADRLDHRPHELSGGQQQRVACARAVISRPSVVFADEPTGNLDSTASAQVLAFLRECAQTFGQSILMVTHDPAAATFAHRVLFLADGALAGELPSPTPADVVAVLAQMVERGAK